MPAERAEENAARTRRAYHHNAGELDAVADFIAAGAVIKGVPIGYAGWRRRVEALRCALPHVEVTVEEVLAVGDRVVPRRRGDGAGGAPRAPGARERAAAPRGPRAAERAGVPSPPASAPRPDRQGARARRVTARRSVARGARPPVRPRGQRGTGAGAARPRRPHREGNRRNEAAVVR